MLHFVLRLACLGKASLLHPQKHPLRCEFETELGFVAKAHPIRSTQSVHIRLVCRVQVLRVDGAHRLVGRTVARGHMRVAL
jgi:hypothetical protein